MGNRLPIKALDIQLDLLRYYTNDSLGHSYANLVVEAALKMAAGAVINDAGKIEIVEGLGFITHRTILATGDTYAVTTDIVDVIEQAAPKLPSFILHADDLPSLHGFVWLERPIVVPDVNGKNLVVRGFGWQTASVQTEDSGEYKPTAIMLAWTDPNDPRDHAKIDWERPEETMGSPLGLLSMIAGVFPLGEDWPDVSPHMRGDFVVEDDDGTEVTVKIEHATASLGRFWLTFLRFIEEPWIHAERIRPDRHLGKRAARAIGHVPEIHVIHLRRAASRSDSEPGDGNVEWSHRWLVRGHWRNQWYPSLQTHKPRWIAEYVKGPEGAPLVVHDKIFSVER